MVTAAYQDKYNEILSQALISLRARTDITQLVPGAKARALLEIVLREIGNAYSVFNADLLESFVKYATGERLDMIGELLGISRLEATRNEVDAEARVQKFYVDSGVFGDINDGSFSIPAGVEITSRETIAGQPIKYVLSEAVTCDAAASSAYGAIKSAEFGEASNIGAGTLVKHNFSLYDDYLNESLKTTNVEGIAYAREKETDDNFRYRIINQSIAGEKANELAVRMAALLVPGVADVTMSEYHQGIGTGAVYIKSVVPLAGDFLVSTVQDAIDEVKSYSSFIEARLPRLVGVELDVTLNLYKSISTLDQNTLKTLVKDTIYSYINSLDINDPLYLEDLVRVILSTDSNIRSLGTLTRPIDHLYVWKYSAAEDNRVSREALAGYVARNFERVVVEYTTLPDSREPIRVKVA